MNAANQLLLPLCPYLDHLVYAAIVREEKRRHLLNPCPCVRLHQDKEGRRGQLPIFFCAVFVRSFGVSKDGLIRERGRIWILNIKIIMTCRTVFMMDPERSRSGFNLDFKIFLPKVY